MSTRSPGSAGWPARSCTDMCPPRGAGVHHPSCPPGPPADTPVSRRSLVPAGSVVHNAPVGRSARVRPRPLGKASLERGGEPVATRGVLFVHAAPSALCPHVEWAVAGVLGVHVSMHWTAQPAARGTYRAELSWQG